MSHVADRELRSGRIRFPEISPRAYEHPADRGALVALRAIPGFDAVLRAVLGAIGERSVRLLYLATAVRVSARQYPELNTMVAECATTLDLYPVPELYVVQDPSPSAMAVGTDKPLIVVSTGHALYRTVLIQLVQISASISWLPLGAWGLRAIVLALHEWFRKAELSAARAGLLCVQDADLALRVHAAMAGALDPDGMDVAGFLDQAKEYQASGDVRDSVLKLLQISGQTHPLAALRAAELQQWAARGEYRAILAGDYPRRGEDRDAPIAEDVRAAAASYQKAFRTSADPLVGLVGKLGGVLGTAGGAAAGRLRDWWQGPTP